MNPQMQETLKNLLGGLKTKLPPFKPGDEPTGVTRLNLNEIIKAGAQMATLAVAEDESFHHYDGRRTTEADPSPAHRVGTAISNTLNEYLSGLGKPGEVMGWGDVREELCGVFTLLAHAVSPAGREELLVRCGLKPAAETKTPVMSAGPIKQMSEAEIKQALDFGKFFGPSVN